MLIFTDLDGTLFDTDVSKQKYIVEWMEEFSNARLKENARETIERLYADGHQIMALTSRGVDCAEYSDELQKISCASILKNFESSKAIMGLQSSVRYKYSAIVGILKKYHFKQNYELKKDVVLVDDDIEQIGISVLGGVKSILFNPPSDFDKNIFLKLANAEGIANADKIVEKNLRVAKNWQDVGKIICEWSKSQNKDEKQDKEVLPEL